MPTTTEERLKNLTWSFKKRGRVLSVEAGK